MIRWLRDYGRIVFALSVLIGSFGSLVVASLIVGPWWIRVVTVALITVTVRLLWASYRTARYIGDHL